MRNKNLHPHSGSETTPPSLDQLLTQTPKRSMENPCEISHFRLIPRILGHLAQLTRCQEGSSRDAYVQSILLEDIKN